MLEHGGGPTSSANTTMLPVAVVAIVMPTIMSEIGQFHEHSATERARHVARFISAILLVLCPRTSSSASARCARCRARAHDEPAAAHSTHLSPPPAAATGTTPTTSRMIVCITTSTGARTMRRAAESLGVF